MAKYFSKFPLTYYSLEDKIKNFDIITNITARFAVERTVKNNTLVYDKYEVKEGETPEIIASKLYNSPERHWIVLLANDIIDVEDQWPLTEYTLNNYIDKKYMVNNVRGSGIRYAMDNIHSYYKVETIKLYSDLNQKTVSEIQVDEDTYNTILESYGDVITISGGRVVRDIERKTKSYFDYELEVNEAKRNIKLFRTDFVEILEQELKKIFGEKVA